MNLSRLELFWSWGVSRPGFVLIKGVVAPDYSQLDRLGPRCKSVEIGLARERYVCKI